MVEPYPCPFCKVKPQLHNTRERGWRVDCVNIQCDFLVKMLDKFPTKEEAVTHWNQSLKK